MPEAITVLSTEEFESVDRFFSRLDTLTDLRNGDIKKWRMEGELIIRDLLAEGNPLK